MSSVNSPLPIVRRRIPKSQRRRDGLIQYAFDITSQNGEDGIIRKIFNDILPLPKDEHGISNKRRYCVDVGAWDGKHLSNTFSLLAPPDGRVGGDSPSHSCSWRGILIEADPERFHDLRTLHGPLGNICVNTIVSSDPTSSNSLVSILRRSAPELPMDFDFLCIDVDGSDYWLLHEIFENRYRPKVVCIESNPTMPNDLIYIPARNDNTRHGCSLAALVELAEDNQYVLVETTLYNAFLVPTEIYEAFFKEHVPDNSIEALHETTMGTELFQLYDGTLKLWGCKKLLWHRVAMDETRMQMLPSSLRTFPFAPSDRNGGTETIINDSIIDVSPYCLSVSSSTRNDENKKICCASLIEQLKLNGFALIRGSGVPGQLCREALRVTHSFLQEADESVRRSCLSQRDRARRGYSPINTENFASLLGEDGPNDLVRKFRMGPPDSSSNQHGVSSLLQANVWPSPSVSTAWDVATCNDFRATLEDYYDRVCSAANEILRAVCDGLLSEYPDLAISLKPLSSSPIVMSSRKGSTSEVADGNIQKPLAHNTSILTLLGYRTGSRHKKLNRKKKKIVHPLVAAHTDVGVITVLLYDGGDCAVLQRKADATSDSGKTHFEDVVLPSQIDDDPIFVVNIADCLSELTCKRLPSTVHRVMPKEGTISRNCLALFVGLKAEEILTIDGHEMSYEAWRKNRIAKSQDVLKQQKGR